MEVSVACARWVTPDGERVQDAQCTDGTFWHTSVIRTPSGGVPDRVGDMLKWFDQARLIVAYNGREFDMRVLKGAYGNDEERWRAHVAKLVDLMETVDQRIIFWTLGSYFRPGGHILDLGIILWTLMIRS